MDNKEFKILLADTPLIGLAEYERIVQSLVAFADVVLAPASLRINSDLDKQVSSHIVNSLSQLMEARRIILWEYPQSRVVAAEGIDLTADRQVETLDANSYSDFYESVIELVRSKSKQAHTDQLHSSTELVYYKNALWPCFLSQYFQANRVVFRPHELESLQAQPNLSRYQSKEERIVRGFLSEQRLPTISVLDAKQIIDLNRQHVDFRKAVAEQADLLNTPNPNEEAIKLAVAKLFDRYYLDTEDLVMSRMTMKGLLSSEIKNSLVLAGSLVGVGALLVLASVFPFADSAVQALREKKKISAVTAYTVKLRRELRKKQ